MGREIPHMDKGINIMNRYCEELSDVSEIDNSIKSEGSKIEVLLISKI
jgi:translation initiation factor IF-3